MLSIICGRLFLIELILLALSLSIKVINRPLLTINNKDINIIDRIDLKILSNKISAKTTIPIILLTKTISTVIDNRYVKNNIILSIIIFLEIEFFLRYRISFIIPHATSIDIKSRVILE